MSTVASPFQEPAELPGQVADEAARARDRATRAVARGTLPEAVAQRRGRLATGLALAGLAGFGVIFAIVRARASEALDLGLMLKLQRASNPRLDRLMAAVSWIGFPPQSRIVPPLLVGGMWLTRLRTEALFQALAWGTGLLSTVLKGIMKRPRPVAGTDLRVVAAPLGGSSFPSGHVITYVGTYGFLAYLLYTRLRSRGARRALVAALLAMIALVGPSRIQQGHHWPTDVTASYLLGTSYLIALIGLYRWVRGRAGRAAARARGRMAK